MNLQKPTNIDCYLEYTCPKKSCSYKVWITLGEAKVKNFKIVCDCGQVYRPKRIQNLNITYSNIHKSKRIPKVPKNSPTDINGVPVDIMEACVTILDGYGFVRTESIKLVSQAYFSCEDKTTIGILKKALTLLEIKNV